MMKKGVELLVSKKIIVKTLLSHCNKLPMAYNKIKYKKWRGSYERFY